MTPKESEQNPIKTPTKEAAALQCPLPFEASPELLKTMQTRFKLTEAQSRVYSALLIMGQLTQDEISLYSGVSFAKVPKIVQVLQERQFINALPGVVSRFRAYAPYKELATEVKNFTEEAETSWKQLQRIQEKTVSDFQNELQSMLRQMKTTLENLNERQGIALNEASMATNIELGNIAKNLQTSLTKLSDNSIDEFSSQTAELQESITQTIEAGINQLQDTQKEGIEDTETAIEGQRDETEEWVTSLANRVIGQTNTIGQQSKTNLQDANAIYKRSTDSGMTKVQAEITTQNEVISELVEDTITTLSNSIQVLNQQIQQSLTSLQKEAEKTLKTNLTLVDEQIQETWTTRSQALDQANTELEKALRKDLRELKQTTEKMVASTDNQLKSSHKTAIQNANTLFQNLNGTITSNIVAWQSIHKEVEATVKQWPPKALEFEQFSKIQSDMNELLERTSVEHEKLLDAISSEFSIELRDTYLGQLLEMRNILQKLVKDLNTQQSNLTTSFKGIASQVGKRLKRRLTTVRNLTESFITDFQAKIALQEEQNRTLTTRTQKLLNQDAASIVHILENIEGQISQFITDRINQMEKVIIQAAKTNIAKATGAQTVVEKQLQSFSAAMKKFIKTTITELKQEITQLETTVTKYSEGIRNTADTLREEQALRIQTTTTEYPDALKALMVKRNRATSRALRKLSTELSNRDTQVISDLNTALSDILPEYALSALTMYQKNLREVLATLEAEAYSIASSELEDQLNMAVHQRVNSLIDKAIKVQLEKTAAEIRTTIKTQKSNYSKQTDPLFSGIQERLTAIQREENEKLSHIVTDALQAEIAKTVQECKTKVSRQTHRKKQINQIIETTLEQIKASTHQILGQNNKTLITQLAEEITNIFQEFGTQLRRQTSRGKQINKIFKETETSLEQIPQQLLPQFFEQQLSGQTTALYAPVEECKTTLQQIHQTFSDSLQENLQSLTSKDETSGAEKPLPAPISTVLKNTTNKVLAQTRTSLKEKRKEVETQVSSVFNTAFENTLTKQLLPKLKALQKEQAPLLKPILEKTGTQVSNVSEKFDSDAQTLLEKYWLPLTQIIDEYSTATAGNLSALNTAIATSLDQASVNSSTTMTMFEDDINNLLTATAQAFNREKTGLQEQITHSITEMQENSISQLQETKILLETLNQDIMTQQASFTQKMDTMIADVELTTSNLGAIRETADAFVVNVESELEQQEGRIENLRKSVQDLIVEQSAAVIEGISEIETKLEDFQQNQLQKAQTIVEEIGQSCTAKIDDQRKAIGSHFQTFTSALSNETEQYVNNLQQEIVQLQTTATKLVEKSAAERNALDSELKAQIENHQVNIISSVEEQYSSINKDISSTLNAFIEQVTSLQSRLLDYLSKWKEEGNATLDSKGMEIGTIIDETLKQTSTQSAELHQAQLSRIAETTEELTQIVQEALSSIDEKTTTISNSLVQSLTTNLKTIQNEIDQLFMNTNTTIEEDIQKANTSLSQEIDQVLQTYSQKLDLTKTRLIRATEDNLRRTTESLQTFKDTASTELRQRSSVIEAALKQNLSSVEEGLVTQTQQTGSRVSRALSEERGNLKTEYQTLTKEFTSNIKMAETNSINVLQKFAKNTEPLLDQLRKQASGTEQILIGLWETLSGAQPTDADRTWRIVSCQGIQHHLLDMFRRVQGTITLVYPSFDEVPLEELSMVQAQNRVHIITTLDGEKQQTAAQRLLKQGNIRIWNNPKMEFYGGSRDGEEVLIAPTHGNQGEIVAVVSDQDSYIALFNQTLGPRWISASKELRVSS